MRLVWIAQVALLASACSLEQITLVDAEDVVVAEAYVELGVPEPGSPEIRNRVMVFLHRTVGGATAGSRPVPGARVTVRRTGGDAIRLVEDTLIEACAGTTPVDGTGTCYTVAEAQRGFADALRPGDALTLAVELPEGGRLTASTIVPGDFALTGIAPGVRCKLPAATPMTLTWSPAAGAWAYVSETSISGIRDALAPAGIAVDEDPLYLLGLSVSASDTTIVFPGEFGLFNRAELDQDLARALQKGLPAGVRARITVAAVDRNYVNWVRGGNFNPSGRVRVPSVRGDGTGVFGSVVVRTLDVVVDPAPDGTPWDAPPCPSGDDS